MQFHFLAVALLSVATTAFARDGQVQIHDPTTAIQCAGTYYTFGTGSGGLI
jgi:arabinan endo-1,5-alpha-L-arabinosidase